MGGQNVKKRWLRQPSRYYNRAHESDWFNPLEAYSGVRATLAEAAALWLVCCVLRKSCQSQSRLNWNHVSSTHANLFSSSHHLLVVVSSSDLLLLLLLFFFRGAVSRSRAFRISILKGSWIFDERKAPAIGCWQGGGVRFCGETNPEPSELSCEVHLVLQKSNINRARLHVLGQTHEWMITVRQTSVE